MYFRSDHLMVIDGRLVDVLARHEYGGNVHLRYYPFSVPGLDIKVLVIERVPNASIATSPAADTRSIREPHAIFRHSHDQPWALKSLLISSKFLLALSLALCLAFHERTTLGRSGLHIRRRCQREKR